MRMRNIPMHRDIVIPKTMMPTVPPGFEKTILGEPKGAIAQYRGPGNLHLREYDDRWTLHRDYGDPRTLGGLIIHIFLDAPEIGISLLIAAGTFKETYEATGSTTKALTEALKVLPVSYIALRTIKALFEYLVQLFSSGSVEYSRLSQNPAVRYEW